MIVSSKSFLKRSIWVSIIRVPLTFKNDLFLPEKRSALPPAKITAYKFLFVFKVDFIVILLKTVVGNLLYPFDNIDSSMKFL